MSGEPPPISVIAEPDTVLARAVEALGTFPTDQPWVLVGGLAVFLRLGSVTRPTADADTVAGSQTDLLRSLTADGLVALVSGGEIEVPVGTGTVQIGVIDLNDVPLPDDVERRAFALARREALRTASEVHALVTSGDGSVVARACIPLATTGALVALKTVSMVRRPHGHHPEKVGSDIHDLVRLVSSCGARTVAKELAAGDRELAFWVASQAIRAFGSDLRYTLLRLRKHDRSPGAQSLTDDDVAARAILGAELQDRLL